MLSFKYMHYLGNTARFGALFLAFVLMCASFSVAPQASAQTLGVGQSASLTTNPSVPAPNSTVVVSLSAYTIDSTGATIRWYVDGGERTDATNARRLTVQTGPVGTQTTVRAVIAPLVGSQITLENVIRPSQTDLIIEADTRTPAFYNGRALPVGDERVRATAIPHVSGGGSPESFTYTWKLDNTVLHGGPVRGQFQTTFRMPKSSARLEVSVFDSSGNRVSGESITITPAAPELHFYEDNPLRSMSRISIGEQFTLVGDEVSVRAEPYFVARDIFNINPVIQWTLDGKHIQNFADEPNVLTLRGTGGSGDATVGFELINQQSLLQFLRSSFTIHFES